MGTKTRPKHYPRVGDLAEPRMTRGEVARERRLSAMADQWCAERGETLERLLGGIVTQSPTVIGWQAGMPRELSDADAARIREQGGATFTSTLPRKRGGRERARWNDAPALAVFDADDVANLDEASIDNVRQSMGLRASPPVGCRTIYRAACVRPCLAAARNPKHRCVDESRTYVRRLAPDKNGRAKWRTVGYWTDGAAAGSLGVGAYTATIARPVAVERPPVTWCDAWHLMDGAPVPDVSSGRCGNLWSTDRLYHYGDDGALDEPLAVPSADAGAPALGPMRPFSGRPMPRPDAVHMVLDRVARAYNVVHVEHGTRSAWVPAKVADAPAMGAPRTKRGKVAAAELDARTLGRAIADSVAGQRWVTLLLEALDLSYSRTQPTAVAAGSHGITASYDPTRPTRQRVRFADGAGRTLAESSWHGRRLAARVAALTVIGD